MCDTLEAAGYGVIAADRPAAALALTGSLDCRIDLLVTDVIMPGMNGSELYERLVSDCPALRVLFMSGYTDNIIAQHGVISEGTAFLQKPFTVRDLLTNVKRRLEDIP